MTVENQQVGSEMFLGNEFLDLGINSSGTLGTVASAPAGFVTDAKDGYIRLGMMADTGGFGSSTPQTRDVMLGGTPVETFSIGYDIGSKQYVNTNSARDGVTQITGGTTTNLSTANTAAAGWEGTTAQGLKVDQVMSVTSDTKYVAVTITLTNTTGQDMTDLRYMRSIDPDQGATFSTNNKIIHQGGDGKGGAEVAAYASGTSTPFFFYSQDARAMVSTYGFENRDPYAAAAYDSPQAAGYTLNGDDAVNIDFSVGTLKAGASTTITYYMGVTDNLDTTVAAINAAAAASTAPPPPPPPPPVNHAPVAVNDKVTVAAGAAATGNVLANDTDADNDTLHAALNTGPAHGVVTIADDGTFKYTPTAGYSGSDSFTYTSSDGKASSVATVTVTVTPPPNHAPVGVNDALTVTAGTVGTGNVLANDTDADNDVLHAALKTNAAHGTVTLADDGTYKYTPTAGYTGADSFTYTVSDGKATSTATVNVTVAPPPNHAPVGVNDALTVTAGTVGTGNVLANDTDADNDVLHAALKTNAAHGTVTLADDGTYKYTPTAGYTGADSFTYTVTDGKATSTATVNVTVAPPPNHAPVAVNDAVTVAAGAVATGNVLANDTDADNDTLHAALNTGPAHGVVTIADDGTFKYTPTAGYSGSDSFTYTSSDGKASSVATVTVTVTPPPNHAPVAVNDAATVAAGAAVSGNVLANDTDADNDVLHAALKTNAAHGVVTLADDGTYKYTPTAGYSGADSFTYTVTDGKATSTATVSLTVTPPPNHAPVAVDDALTVAAGAVGTGNVLANDTDADNDTLHAAIETKAAHGVVTVNDNGTFSYTPNAGYSGSDSFTYSVSDGKASDTATVTVTVTPPPNHAPVAVDDTATVAAGAAVTGNILANDTDADNDALHAALKTGPAHGVLTLADDGTYKYTPTAGYSGSDSFTYTVTDGKATSTATVSLTVTPPPNHAPVAVNDAVTVAAGATATGNVLANDTDADNDTLHAALKTNAAHGVVTLNDDGTFSYTAAAGYSGTDSFTYTASDGHTSSLATVEITVQAPVVVSPPPGGGGKGSSGTSTSGTGQSGTGTDAPPPVVHDGSGATNDKMVATNGVDQFYFNNPTKTGQDAVTGFGSDDQVVTKAKLYDGNNDGVITFVGNKLALDLPKGADTVLLSGVSALKLMGQNSDGNYVYVNDANTPKGALESVIGNDTLKGDVGDKTAQTVFFDTNLKLGLGNDQVTNFGAKDTLVTTTALATDTSGHVNLTGGMLSLVDSDGDSVGSAHLTGLTGAAVGQLEFDGTVDHGGLTYYLYSAAGSTSAHTIGF
jgi:VCBS repeat-containing protein